MDRDSNLKLARVGPGGFSETGTGTVTRSLCPHYLLLLLLLLLLLVRDY